MTEAGPGFVGGKGFDLGRLLKAGLLVPDGFCVPTAACRLVCGLGEAVSRIRELAAPGTRSVEDTERLAAGIREAIVATSLWRW